MEINLTTPALLFPAISLLLLAYTNRFLAIASLIRGLKKQYENEHDTNVLDQIKNLQKRIILIRNMQAAGIASIMCCVLCMFELYLGYTFSAKLIFGFSLLLMLLSLFLSFRETLISVQALNLELKKLLNETRHSAK
jgi:hypothetical protein